MAKLRTIHRLDDVVGLFGALILIVFWLVVATFPAFFLFNPFKQSDVIRRFELALSTLGWLGISTVVPFLLFLYASGKTNFRKYLLFFALIYPLSLVTSQITVWIRDGSPYLSYLVNFPIFIFTDLLLPIMLIFLWHDLKEKQLDGIE
jgi:hypothetical protein